MPQYKALRATVRKEAVRRTKNAKEADELEALTWKDTVEPQLRELYAQRLRNDRNNFRVLCLSKCRPTSSGAALMMGHYSELQKGFAYEFDDHHPWFSDHDERVYPQRAIRCVVYRGERATIRGDGRMGLFVKSTPWKYEREVRLLRTVIHGANALGGGGQDIASYPPAMLRSITLGYEANSRTIGKVRSQLKANPALGHVKLFKLQLDPYRFRFMAKPMAV